MAKQVTPPVWREGALFQVRFMPEWRNRQTRRSQKPLSSMYGFKSHLRHHIKDIYSKLI